MGGVFISSHYLFFGSTFLESLMDEKMTDSRLVDLYDDMLYERAAKGIRPVLYVSSARDLQCSVLVLLEKTAEETFESPQHLVATGVRHTVVTH
jgi:hypothetical protein